MLEPDKGGARGRPTAGQRASSEPPARRRSGRIGRGRRAPGRSAALLIASLGLACNGAAAAPSAPEAAAAGDALPEVVVTGERAGPGLWRVHGGTAELWILGTVAPLPKDMTWRPRQVEDVLAHANAVVIAKPFEVGIVKILWLLVTEREVLRPPRGGRLRDAMPADLYARFAAQRARFTTDPGKWEHFRPIVAAAFLQEAALRRVGLATRADVAPQVRKLARKAGVRVEEVRLAGLRDALDALRTMPPDTERKCTAAMLATVESGLPRLVARADAWASGDIERIESLPEPAEVSACRAAASGGGGPSELLERIRAAWLASLEAHLRGGGTTLAVVGMDLLLQKGGLLDELRARGYRVDPPE